jgi:glycosyltransferase involved in cell wall biosynthesis
MTEPFVSILMLVHNAPRFAELAIRGVHERTPQRHELVVLDNASDAVTENLLRRLARDGFIDKLVRLDYNSFFAEGNNRAAAVADPEATHYLLLNSDVDIRSNQWLGRLLAVHRRGMTGYGVAPDPLRVDGYCLLIDADVYRSHPLDEEHQWFWSVTKMQAAALREGLSVQGYAKHEAFLHHFGGRSGSGFKDARGMHVPRSEVERWFDGHVPQVLDRRTDGSVPTSVGFLARARRKLARLAARRE